VAMKARARSSSRSWLSCHCHNNVKLKPSGFTPSGLSETSPLGSPPSRSGSQRLSSGAATNEESALARADFRFERTVSEEVASTGTNACAVSARCGTGCSDAKMPLRPRMQGCRPACRLETDAAPGLKRQGAGGCRMGDKPAVRAVPGSPLRARSLRRGYRGGWIRGGAGGGPPAIVIDARTRTAAGP
jgi:hypothetical protein